VSQPIRVLIVEDSPDDAELAMRKLRRDGYDPPEALGAALESAVALEAGADRYIPKYHIHRLAPAALDLLISDAWQRCADSGAARWRIAPGWRGPGRQ
jgi:CheY-like chemotaxis protein